jgi:hypothetical protein
VRFCGDTATLAAVRQSVSLPDALRKVLTINDLPSIDGCPKPVAPILFFLFLPGVE